MKYLNRNLILECLEELADSSLQERLWTGKMPEQQSSLVEAVEGLFTDSGLDGELGKGTTGFSDESESKLEELDRELKKVDANRSAETVINDPAMSRVRDLAASALKLLRNEMK